MRGIAEGGDGTEGPWLGHCAQTHRPSTTLRAVPLPLRGRMFGVRGKQSVRAELVEARVGLGTSASRHCPSTGSGRTEVLKLSEAKFPETAP